MKKKQFRKGPWKPRDYKPAIESTSKEHIYTYTREYIRTGAR